MSLHLAEQAHGHSLLTLADWPSRCAFSASTTGTPRREGAARHAIRKEARLLLSKVTTSVGSTCRQPEEMQRTASASVSRAAPSVREGRREL